MYIKTFIFSFIFFSYTSPSFSYFDPGTGMFILQAIVAGISVFFFYLINPKLLLKKIKNKIKSLFNKKTNSVEEISADVEKISTDENGTKKD